MRLPKVRRRSELVKNEDLLALFVLKASNARENFGSCIEKSIKLKERIVLLRGERRFDGMSEKWRQDFSEDSSDDAKMQLKKRVSILCRNFFFKNYNKNFQL